MEVRARLEQTSSLSPYPGPRSLRSLSFPAGVRALWTATAAPALEAQHGGVHRRWRALPRVLCGVSAPRGVLPQPYKEFGGAGAAPPAALRRPLLPPPAGRAAGTQPALRARPGRGLRRGRAASAQGGCESPPGPRRPGTPLGAFGPRTRVPLRSVAMSSVFGKPRGGGGQQSAPLEVNLAILGRRGAGKSGEWGGCQGGMGVSCGPGSRWRDPGAVGLRAHSPTGLGGRLHPVSWARHGFSSLPRVLSSLGMTVAWHSLRFALSSSISHLSSVPCLALPRCLPTCFCAPCLHPSFLSLLSISVSL